jgi:hypothetical protein
MLRLGLLVNIVFLLLGCLVVIMMIIALETQVEIRDRVKQEFVTQLVHSGYSLYLIAGSAFFGAYAFSDAMSKQFVPFALSWLLWLSLLLLIEFVRVRLKPPKSKFSLSRKLALLLALSFNYWVWVGAQWPEVSA